jgi:hypothetical protein
MGTVLLDMSMSLGGFAAGPDDNPDQPLGLGGSRLHDWMFDRSARGSARASRCSAGQASRRNWSQSRSSRRLGSRTCGSGCSGDPGALRGRAQPPDRSPGSATADEATPPDPGPDPGHVADLPTRPCAPRRTRTWQVTGRAVTRRRRRCATRAQAPRRAQASRRSHEPRRSCPSADPGSALLARAPAPLAQIALPSRR